jgi:hypothetical protein
MSSFHVDARIGVKLEVELALRLGEMILASGSEDKQILALGHMLCNIDKDEPEATQAKWTPRNKSKVSSIVSEWQEEETRPMTMHDKIKNRKCSQSEKWGFE